jgi:hypothetical protein
VRVTASNITEEEALVGGSASIKEMAAAGVSKEKTVRFSNYIMQEETQSLLVRKIDAGENRVRSE